MDNKDRTTTEIYESETISGHNELIEKTEDHPKPIIFQFRQEPRHNMIRLMKKKHYQMRRV